MIAEKEFNILDDTAQYRQNVEPLKYCWHLLVGIFFLIISLIIIVHIFLFLLLKINGKSIDPFLNKFLEDI